MAVIMVQRRVTSGCTAQKVRMSRMTVEQSSAGDGRVEVDKGLAHSSFHSKYSKHHGASSSSSFLVDLILLELVFSKTMLTG